LNFEPIFAAEAPAKINRELRVGALRPDGFHEIRSRLVTIDLCDSISVAPGLGELELSCEGLALPASESNLVVRAARALAVRLGRPADARIHLTKRIPIAAGLGGGSSDAALALRLLSRLWKAGLSTGELAELAAGLGSDVPFFLVGGEADVGGRGEEVRPVPDSESVELLLLIPPFPISTREAYLARRRTVPERGDEPLPTSLDVETSGRFFGPNDLAFAVLQMRSEMSVLLDSARSLASEAAITGSGSTIVMKGASADAPSRLAARHPETRLHRCRTLSREEYRVRTESSGGFNGDHTSQSLSR
jgi:4-diphosphocytidyl-2-C-methyl-D-erythritol kinase